VEIDVAGSLLAVSLVLYRAPQIRRSEGFARLQQEGPQPPPSEEESNAALNHRELGCRARGVHDMKMV
jgi:hypothetical protein